MKTWAVTCAVYKHLTFLEDKLVRYNMFMY